MMVRLSLIKKGTLVAVAVLCAVAVFVITKGVEPPRGHNTPAWELITSIEAVDTSDDILPNVVKTFPDALRTGTHDFEIEGYLMRFVSEPYLQDFILLPDPPECPFCGSSGYGPYLEVRMQTPLEDLPNYTKLRVRGTLELIEDPTVYETTRLVDGILIE